MTGPAIDDEQSSVHRRALQLRRHLVDLDTAAQMLDLVDPDRDAPTDPPPGLHELAAVADRAFTQYLIDHRNVLGRMCFWNLDYQLIDRDPRAVRTVTFDVGVAPPAGTVCRPPKSLTSNRRCLGADSRSELFDQIRPWARFLSRGGL